jgi:hypothetical protein
MATISLLDLPVELLYGIFDHFDILIILRSLRFVCKKLYAVVATYDRYKLNIASMSMSDLIFISHRILPESIISLTVYSKYTNTNQLEWFQSIFNIRRFTRLHSLTLINIRDNDVQNFFKNICYFQVRGYFHLFVKSLIGISDFD